MVPLASLHGFGQSSDASQYQTDQELNPPLNQTSVQPAMAFPTTYESGSPTLGTNPFYSTGQNDISQIATWSELNGAFLQQGGLNGVDTSSLFTTSESPIKPIHLGPFMLETAIASNAVTDDNILVQGANRISDTMVSVTPAFRLEYGDLDGEKATGSLTYAPSITRFLKETSQNSTNQFLSLNVSYPFAEWTFFLNQGYALSTGTDTDVHNRVTQESFDTTIGASYQVDEKLSINSSFNQSINAFVDGGAISTDSWTIDTSAGFRPTEKLTVGPEFLFGLDDPQGNDAQEYIQILEALTYQPTLKISLYSSAGIEVRQFNQGGGNAINPVFRAGMSYTPFDSTSIDLAGFQTVRTSTLSSSQTVLTTGAGITLTQRFLHRFFLSLNASYEHVDYTTNEGSVTSTPATNEDDIILRPSLSVSPTQWTSLSVYYQYQDTVSSQAANSFHDQQAGISFTVQL